MIPGAVFRRFGPSWRHSFNESVSRCFELESPTIRTFVFVEFSLNTAFCGAKYSGPSCFISGVTISMIPAAS